MKSEIDENARIHGGHIFNDQSDGRVIHLRFVLGRKDDIQPQATEGSKEPFSSGFWHMRN